MYSQQQLKVENKSKPFDALQAILDNLALIVISSVIGAIIVVTGAILTHKSYYTITATILFEPSIPELVYESPERYLHSFEDWMRTQTHEIESHHVLNNAITVYEKSGFKWRFPGESEKVAADRLRGRVDVSQINNTQIMRISMGSSKKEGLAEIVNLVVNKYIQHKDQQRKKQDQKKITYLREERDKFGLRLEKSYQVLMNISRKYGTAVSDEKNLYIYLNTFMDLRSRYNQILIKQIETENKLRALENQKKRLKNLEIYNFENTQLLLEMEQEIQAKMVGMREDSQEYARMIALLKEVDAKNIETARKYLLSEIEKEIDLQTTLYESARDSKKDLKVELDKAQVEVMEFNTAVLRASTQRQEIERFISIWNRINERIEQIQIELFNPGRVRVLSAALPPELPDPDKLMKKIFLGIFGVVGLGIGLGVIRGFMDNTIKRTADIEKTLGFPATGFLTDGKAEKIDEDKMFNIYKSYPDSYLAELYQQLAVRVEKEHLKHDSRVYAMFSLKGGSGSTSVISNLLAAIDAPDSGKLMIDLNIRNPLNNQFERYQNSPGIAGWLSGKHTLDKCVVNDSQFPFSVLPFGNLDQLNVPRFQYSKIEEILTHFRKNYQYIFIDAPPVLLTSEAQKIAQLTDVSIALLDAQKDIWADLIQAMEILKKLGVQVISVILNKTPALRNGYLRKSIKEYYAGRLSTVTKNAEGARG